VIVSELYVMYLGDGVKVIFTGSWRLYPSIISLVIYTLYILVVYPYIPTDIGPEPIAAHAIDGHSRRIYISPRIKGYGGFKVRLTSY
jgi:hypothetical protein